MLVPVLLGAAPMSPTTTSQTPLSACSPFPPERTSSSGGEQTIPLSASPQRTDPRPPTVRSVAQDLASQIRYVSGGDALIGRSIVEELLRDLDGGASTTAIVDVAAQKAAHTAALLLASLKDYVTGPLTTSNSGGTRTVEQTKSITAIATAVHSLEVERQRLVQAAIDLTGLSRVMWKNGGELRQSNEEAGQSDLRVGGERSTRVDRQDLDFIYDWFHDQSPDVEPDKSTKFHYKRKRVHCAGTRSRSRVFFRFALSKRSLH